jgi:hypothetical protein
MLNIKWGVIAGAAALILSLAVGALSGNNIFYVLLRALIFGVVFFGLGLGIWALVTGFVPELLYADSDIGGGAGETPSPGSRINITLDGGTGALPEMYRNPDNPEEVGNISDLITGAINPAAAAPSGGMRSGGMDQNREDGYTYNEGGGAENQNQDSEFGNVSAFDGSPSFQEGQNAAAVFTPAFGGGGGLGGLPDLDAMAGAFLTNAGLESGPASPVAAPVMPAMPQEPGAPERKHAGNKPQPLQGDFNPKELAQGIRTVLSKET